MLPSISQQIQSIKTRLEETILPEVANSSAFVQEQAALILMSLEWILDTHEHQYRYEVVENADYRKLLTDMIKLEAAGSAGADLVRSIRQVIQEPGPDAQEASIPLSAVAEQNRRLKKLAANLYREFARDHASKSNPAREMLAQVALRQGDRELAFFKRTGYTKTPDNIGTILYDGGD